MVCWRLQQEDSGSAFIEGQQGTNRFSFYLFKFLYSGFQISLDLLSFMFVFPRRTALFSFDTVRPRAVGSRTPSPCSSRRRSTTFPFATCRSSEDSLLAKRERRTKR